MEISSIPENIESKDLENLTLKILDKIDTSVHPENVENCHWVKIQRSKKSDNQVIQMKRCQQDSF